MKHITFWSRRIKFAVHVDVNGDIENIGIIVEGTLTSVSWRYLASQISRVNAELYTMMDIPTRKDFR